MGSSTKTTKPLLDIWLWLCYGSGYVLVMMNDHAITNGTWGNWAITNKSHVTYAWFLCIEVNGKFQ